MSEQTDTATAPVQTTPGPWVARRGRCDGQDQLYWDILDSDPDYPLSIALVFSKDNSGAEGAANARLIAAAPLMFGALLAARSMWCWDKSSGGQDALRLIDAAIAAAETRP